MLELTMELMVIKSEIKKYLWKEYFWSGSYFLAIVLVVSLGKYYRLDYR